MTAPTAQSPATFDAPYGRDKPWGNALLAPRGWYGQYRINGRDLFTGEQRVILVCGEMRSGKHNAWWIFDEGAMRPVCSRCWPMQQGRR